jgi:hypothetical protein
MDYSVGSRVRVRLYSGKIVEAEIVAIVNRSTGRKIQVVYGKITNLVNPEQITDFYIEQPGPSRICYAPFGVKYTACWTRKKHD